MRTVRSTITLLLAFLLTAALNYEAFLWAYALGYEAGKKEA